jgi:hypothetical protein
MPRTTTLTDVHEHLADAAFALSDAIPDLSQKDAHAAMEIARQLAAVQRLLIELTNPRLVPAGSR